MRSKSFDTQKAREIGRKEVGESRGFSISMDGNDRRCLPDGRKEMQRPTKIENVYKRIHARAGKVLQHQINDTVWASGSRKIFSAGKW